MTRITAAVALALLLAAGVAVGAASPAAGGGAHLFLVSSDGAAAVALEETDARVIARYESFSLVEATGDDAELLQRAGAERRDDMRAVQLGRRSLDPSRDRQGLSRKRDGGDGPGLALVQFVGPIKDAWLERLRDTGVRVVTYMAQNGYLVHGSERELARAARLVGRHPAVRAVLPYGTRDKLQVGVKSSGRQRLAIQTLSGRDGSTARSDAAAEGRPLRETSTVGPLRTQYLEIDAAEATRLARDPGVVSVLPAPTPKPMDEAQDQILAGNVTGGGPLVPSGPGYLSFVDALAGTTTFPFAVDVTDSGIDAGVVATTHPDLQENGGGATRLDYNDDFTTDSDARDCGGHGTINAGIVGGYNDGTTAAVEDASGFNYGLGIAPRTRLGGSKIFRCDGGFSLSGSFTSLTGNAYTKGARISSNSWGADLAGVYDAQTQEYDALVRDALPGTPGNQEMVEVFAAGNDGFGGTTVGTPGSAKNVITVGAAENVRASGTDGCGVTNAGADDARDIIDFSSRGPTADGRTKPDVVGPGTHIVGTRPQHGGFTGGGVCNGAFPSGSTLYSLSSGTSHSTPAIAGIAALVRHWYSAGPGAGSPPSPALTKAILANSATDLAGGDDGAGGTNSSVPDPVQGWGLANIGRALEAGPRAFRDQQDLLGASGESLDETFVVQDPSKPVRVTLAYTDAPGPTTGSAFVNDLNLVVAASSGTFKGNVLSAGQSVPGGSADFRNNLESVYLPAGASGNFSVGVDAANIAGNGVPGNGDPTDQDFALVVSNAAPTTAPVLRDGGGSVSESGDGDGAIEPGESFEVSQVLENSGNGDASAISGTLSGPGSVTFPDASSPWPDLIPGAAAANSDALVGALDASATCGAPVTVTLAITSSGGATSVPVTFATGHAGSPVGFGGADVPKPIPDANPGGTASTLNVSPAGIVKDVNVRIGSLTHTWVGDLKLDITAPDGTTVNLAARPGGINNSANNFTNVTFDDEASSPIGAPTGTTPAYTGFFRPQWDRLSRFDGNQQQGAWSLRVADFVELDTGSIGSWGIDGSPATCGSGAGAPTGGGGGGGGFGQWSGPGGGGGGGTVGEEDDTAPAIPVLPKLDLSRVPGSIRVDARGRFTLSFDTNHAGSLALRRVRRALASASFAAPSSGVVELRLRLKRKHRRLLRARRRLRVSLAVSAGDLSARKTLKLNAPRKKRRH